MNIRFQILTILIGSFFLFPTLSSGTAQQPDYLIYEGDTLPIFSNPLEQYLNSNTKAREMLGAELDGCSSTACWRGYIGYWTLQNDSLFLVDLRHCCFEEVSAKNNFPILFNKEILGEQVFADWFTGKVVIPVGKQIKYIHMGYASIYEKERLFYFEHGVLTEKRDFKNPKIASIYADEAELQKFISSKIDWSSIDRKTSSIQMIAAIRVDTRGNIDSVRIRRSSSENFNDEMTQVIKEIPNWAVYYQRGETSPQWWTIPINIDRKKKN